MKKLILGSANFGNEYQNQGQISCLNHQEVQQLISVCREFNIDQVDTAQDYGESEDILGKIGTEGLKISTKVKAFGAKSYVGGTLKKLVQGSLLRLRCNKIDVLYFHRVDDFKYTNENYTNLLLDVISLKENGLIDHVGVSIYTPDDVKYLNLDHIDILQFPCSIIDGRWSSVFTRKFRQKYPRLYLSARSIFLNGYLLNLEKFKKRFPQYMSLIAELEKNRSFSSPNSRLAYCLSAIENMDYVDSILVGVQSAAQLREIAEAQISSVPITSTPVSSEPALLDIRLWN